MTKKEIDILVDNDDIYDMLMYIYCLKRAPEQFANVPNVASELQQAKSHLVSAIKSKNNRF